MSIMATLRRILNDTPGTATNIDYNFAVVEDYINSSVVTTDGANSMSGTLVLSGPPTDPLHAASKGYVDSLWFTGMSVDYGGDVAPQGWVLENGASYSSTDPKFVALFQVIGYRFGDAGGGNFRVPPAGRFVFSADATHAIGTTGGSADAQLLQHVHTVPEHGHAASGSAGDDTPGHAHSFSGATAGEGGHSHTSNGGHSEYVFRDSQFFTGYSAPHETFGGSALVLTWGPTAGGNHAHVFSGGTDGANRNHSHSVSVSVNNQVAFNTTNAGSGTTLTGVNMPPYVVMNRIMKL